MGWFLPPHVDTGSIFVFLGMWHVYNTLRSYIDCPKEFKSRTWYPGPWHSSLRCIELWILLTIVVIYIAKQLSHATEDLESGIILSGHLLRFQHVTFGLFFLVYSVVALIHANSVRLPLPDGVLSATFALGFLSELLIIHFGHHNGDTLEIYVHMLLQLLLATLVTLMFLEILYPNSVIVALGRSMCLTFKGTWLAHIGLLISSPAYVPLGCMTPVDEQFPVCLNHMDDMRAKAIQVLVFVMQTMGIVVVTYVAYAALLTISSLKSPDIQPVLLLKEHNNQIYIAVDPEKEFQDAADAAGVPILNELSKSPSKPFATSAAPSPVSKV